MTLLPMLGTLSSYAAATSGHDVSICAQSYCALLDHVWWLSLGGLLFFFLREKEEELVWGIREMGGKNWEKREGKLIL